MARRSNFLPKNRRRDMARHMKMRPKQTGFLANRFERAERRHVKRILGHGETPDSAQHRHSALWEMW